MKDLVLVDVGTAPGVVVHSTDDGKELDDMGKLYASQVGRDVYVYQHVFTFKYTPPDLAGVDPPTVRGMAPSETENKSSVVNTPGAGPLLNVID